MARVPYVQREDLDPEGQAVYDRIREDRNIAEVGLQFRALLNSPEPTGHLASLGAYMRFKTLMPANLRELAVILVAREWNSDLEWTAHSAAAAREGIADSIIEAIRLRQTPVDLSNEETVIVRFVQQLLQDKAISDEAFNAARELLGTKGVVDLTLAVSYYSALAMAQIALELGMEEGRASTL